MELVLVATLIGLGDDVVDSHGESVHLYLHLDPSLVLSWTSL